jgi:hypothetical protein
VVVGPWFVEKNKGTVFDFIVVFILKVSLLLYVAFFLESYIIKPHFFFLSLNVNLGEAPDKREKKVLKKIFVVSAKVSLSLNSLIVDTFALIMNRQV